VSNLPSFLPRSHASSVFKYPATQPSLMRHFPLQPLEHALRFFVGLIVVWCFAAQGLAQAQETITAPSTGVVNAPVSVDFGNLAAPTYDINWGDGQVDPITVTRGVTTQTLPHTYSSTGVFSIQLSTFAGRGAVVVASAAITINNAVGCSVVITPNPATVGSPVTGSVTGLPPALSVDLDWGDGSAPDALTAGASGTVSQTHTFASTGAFVVALKSAGVTACQTTSVVAYPTPGLSLTPDPVTLGTAVTANLSSLYSSLTYTLDWGDGSTDTITNPTQATDSLTHTFSSVGVKTVRLSAPGVPTVIRPVTVNVPTATLNLAPTSLIVMQTVTATVSGLLPAVTYTLDWGLGELETVSGQTAVTLTHSYLTPAPRVLRLSANGMIDVTASLSVTLPTCSFSSDPSAILLGESVNAHVSGLPAGFAFSIQWGDVTEAFTAPASGTFSVSHAYASTGGYALRALYDTTTLCPEVTNVTVSVPNPQLTVDNPNPLINQTFTTNLSSLAPGVTYTLDWGDGATETVSNQNNASFTHAFSSIGPKVLQLSVSAPANLAVPPATMTVNVKALTPTLNATPTVMLGAPVTANLAGLTTGVTYTLDWGDGQTDSISDPSTKTLTHTYSSTGPKTVQLTAASLIPQVSSVQVIAPSLSFTPSDPVVSQNVQVVVQNAFAGLGYTLNWGDGTSDPLPVGGVLNHAYTSAGAKVVTLEAPAGYTMPSVTATVPVGAASCSLSTDFGSLLLGMSVKASGNLAYPGMALTLDWGDGSTEPVVSNATAQYSADHLYADRGVYQLKVLLGTTPLCQTSVTVTVPTPTLTLSGGALLGQPVTASIASLAPGVTYTLDWGDGQSETISNLTSASRSHTFSSTGVKPVQVLTPSTFGVAPVSQNSTPLAPILSAASSSLLVGQTLTVTLNDLNPALSYILQWGDGSTATVVSPANSQTHVYWSGGPKLVSLELPAGFSATLAPTTVSVIAPSLNVTPTSPFPLETLTLTLADLNTALTYSLAWGDGGTDIITGKSNTSLTHAFAAAGATTITLHEANMTPDLTLPVVVRQASCTSSLNPSSVQIGAITTLSVIGLPAGFAFSLDWGDGGTQAATANASGGLNADHAYSSTGAFVIRALYGMDTLCQTTATVTVPTPVIGIAPQTASVGETVTASLSSLAAGVTYTLDWGDGQTETISNQVSASLTHAYSSTGTKLVQLTAPAGVHLPPITGSVTVSIPTATLNLTPASVLLGQSVTASVSNLVGAVTYTLDWGDGSSETISNQTSTSLTHTYSSTGIKAIHLTAPPAISLPVTTATVTISIPTPTLVLTPSSGKVGLSVTANLAGLAPGVTYALDWGDGSSETISNQTSASPSHQYIRDGTMVVTLSAPTGLGIAPASANLTLSAPTLQVSPTSAAPTQTVTASLGNLEPSLSYSLDWGDGSPLETVNGQASLNLTHAYSSLGVKTLTLTMPFGLSTTTPITTTLSISNPSCTLTITPNTVLYGLPVTAAGTGLPAGISIVLDWGDSTQDTLTTTASGTFSASHNVLGYGPVTLKALLGASVLCQASLTTTVPTPTMTAGAASALLGQAVSLNLGSLAPGVNYRLDWGDGTIETITGQTSATASHTFTRTGIKGMQLSTQGTFGITPVFATVTINPPGIAFAGSVLLGQPLHLSASDLVASLTYALDWGDGSSDTISNQTGLSLDHSYSSIGAKIATLTPSAPYTTASAVQAVASVTVPTPSLTLTPSTGVLFGESVMANLSSLAPGVTYTLDWGDGVSNTVTGQTSTSLTHTHTSAGTKLVLLTTPAAFGIVPVGQNLNVAAPQSGVSPTTAVPTQTVTATFSSLNPNLSYTLDWGDGQTETITGKASASLTHTYSSLGAKTVQFGPAGAIATVGTVNVTLPTCTPTLSPASLLLGETLTFSGILANTSGLPLSIDWGDGSSASLSTDANGAFSTQHTYSSAGNFSVSAKYGIDPVCQGSLNVSVPQPTLSLPANLSSIAVGQGLGVQLGNLLPVLSYALDWGDGTTDTITGQTGLTVTHVYSSAGVKTITLAPPAGFALSPATASVTATIPNWTLNLTPASATPGQAVTASIAGLVSSVAYALDWGDGQTDTITGQTSTNINHTYSSTGQKNIALHLSGETPTTFLGFVVNAPGLSLTANTVALGASLGANLSNLATNLTYTLDWGDGQTDTISNQTGINLTHAYSSAGLKTITLGLPTGFSTATPIQANVFVSNPTCTTSATTLRLGEPLGLQGAAFVPNSALSVHWGDGSSDPITSDATGGFNASHTYTGAGSFNLSVDAGVLCQTTISVSIPTCQPRTLRGLHARACQPRTGPDLHARVGRRAQRHNQQRDQQKPAVQLLERWLEDDYPDCDWCSSRDAAADRPGPEHHARSGKCPARSDDHCNG
jgi:hypothetical protein